MGSDIENPDPVAAAEPSRNTFRNSNGAGGDDKTPIVCGVAGTAAGKTVHCYCGCPNNVLYVCTAIVFLVAVASWVPHLRDQMYGIENTEHLVVSCIGVIVGIPLSLCLFFVTQYISEIIG